MTDTKKVKFLLDRQRLIDELASANSKEKSVIESLLSVVALIFLILLAAYTGYNDAINRDIGLSLAIFVIVFFCLFWIFRLQRRINLIIKILIMEKRDEPS